MLRRAFPVFFSLNTNASFATNEILLRKTGFYLIIPTIIITFAGRKLSFIQVSWKLTMETRATCSVSYW